MDKKTSKTIQVTLEGQSFAIEQGTSIQELIESRLPQRRADALALVEEGKIKGLRWQPHQDVTITLLDYQQEEARRMYERTARFLFLLAVRDVLPGSRVRFDHSAGYGVYATLQGKTMSAAMVRRIEQRMRELVCEDLPFVHTRWSRAQAIEYYQQQDQPDKVHLMEQSKQGTFDLYTCAGMTEYFFGELLPSTGYLSHFSLSFYLPGVVLQLPAPHDRSRVEPFARRPKLLRAYQQSARWGQVLHLRTAADLNDAILSGRLRETVRISEALHEKSVAGMADDIAERGARLVLVAGPSSSGKTTFTHRLAIQLRVNALEPVIISLDNYYRDRDEVPLGDDGEPDLEHIEALDLPLFGEHLVSLLAGEEIQMPRFSFRTGKRKAEGVPLRIRRDQPILVEGIHGLNPRLTEAVPVELTYRIYISALTTLNLDDHNRIRTTDVRLLRRLVRDYQFRHSAPERTFSMWPAVREGEEKYIFPFQEQSDIMFNSSLPYELALLKVYADPLLKGVTPDNPYYLQADRLARFLDFFMAGDVENEVPPTSLLREFIGGATFYME